MKTLTHDVEKLVQEEYNRAAEKFGKQHNSPHEAYAVIKEEYEEAVLEITFLHDTMNDFWLAVKANESENQAKEIDVIYNKAILAACELIQVAAMAHKAKQGY